MNIVHRFPLLKVASALLWMPFVILLLGLYSLTFPVVSEKVFASILESQGIQGVSFSVRELSLKSLVLEDIAVLDEASVGKITISYSINTLLKSRMTRVEVSGLKANLTIKNGEISSPFLESMKGDSSTGGAIMLPFESVAIHDGLLNLTLDDKSYRFDINSETNISADINPAHLKVEVQEKDVKGSFEADVHWNFEEVIAHFATSAEVVQFFLPDVFLEGAKVDFSGNLAFRDGKLAVNLKKGEFALKNLSLNKQKGLFREPFTFHLNEKEENSITLTTDDVAGTTLDYLLALEGVSAFLDLPLEEKTSLQTDIFLYQVALSGNSVLASEPEKQKMTLNYAVQEGWFQVPDYEIEGNRIFLSGSLNELLTGGGNLKGEFTHTSEPPVLNVVTVKSDFNLTADSITLDGKVNDLFEYLRLSFKSDYQFDSKKGSASLVVDPLVFLEGKNQLSEFSPLAAQFLLQFAGKVGLQTNIIFDQKGVKPDIVVSLADGSFAAGETIVSGVTSRLLINNLSPVTTQKHQEITIAKVGLPAPMENVKAVFSVGKKKVIVSRLGWDWMKGKVTVEPFSVDRETAYPDNVKVVLQEIDLSELLELIKQPGLTGKGRLKGVLPVSFQSDGEFAIAGGILEDDGTEGIIRYMPDDATYSMAQENENMSLLFRALEDFHYNKVQIKIDGNSREAVSAALHIRGANPSLYNGRTVELNISLGGALLELIKSAIGFYTLPETLKKRYDNGKNQ